MFISFYFSNWILHYTCIVGGASGTLISNQIAFHMKSTLDWSFASAMGLMLLAGVLAIYWVYNKLVGVDNIKLG